jgi:hypothetical protein
VLQLIFQIFEYREILLFFIPKHFGDQLKDISEDELKQLLLKIGNAKLDSLGYVSLVNGKTGQRRLESRQEACF